MIKNKCYCDICGRETVRGAKSAVVCGHSYKLAVERGDGVVSIMDLCSKCQRNMIRFVKKNIENDEDAVKN